MIDGREVQRCRGVPKRERETWGQRDKRDKAELYIYLWSRMGVMVLVSDANANLLILENTGEQLSGGPTRVPYREM